MRRNMGTDTVGPNGIDTYPESRPYVDEIWTHTVGQLELVRVQRGALCFTLAWRVKPLLSPLTRSNGAGQDAGDCR